MAAPDFKYRAFISYAHANENWAKWLHKTLETYRIPSRLVGQETEFGPVPAKLSPVFRDREELASATDLGDKLTSALENSAALIVICSRASAHSHWVNEEILAYKRLGRSARVFSLIVDGEPYSTGIPGEEDNECFPEALRFQLGADGELGKEPAEPIAADARPGKDGKGNARIKLIAGILGVGYDELRQRELHRRNRRLAFISVSAVAGMLFAIGLATTAVIARYEAERQRERAEREAETAKQTAEFMIDLFAVSDPGEARGRSITALEILTRGADRIRGELSGQPRIQATLMDTIGRVYTNLGLYEDAGAMLRDAMALRSELPNPPAEDTASTLFNLANVTTEQADYAAASALYQQALVELHGAGLGGSALYVDVTAALAELYFRQGDYAGAEPLLREVHGQRLKLYGHEHPSVADAIEELGLNQFDQGNLAEAERHLRDALQLRWQILGDAPHPDLAENLNNLALLLETMGNTAEAESLYNQALTMNRALYRGAHPLIAVTMGNLAQAYRLQGKYAEAEALYREAIAMQRDLLGAQHPAIAQLLGNLARTLHDRGEVEAAFATANEALEMQHATLGEDHPEVAFTLRMLGQWYTEAGNPAQAETLLRTALGMQEEQLGAEHPSTAVTRMALAQALLKLGDSSEALQLAALAEDDLRAALSETHELTIQAKGLHGQALLAQGEDQRRGQSLTE